MTTRPTTLPRTRAALTALALLALTACGGSSSTETTPRSEPDLNPPALFRVTSPEGTTAHLMGTIHTRVTLDEALPPAMATLLMEAPEVYVEMVVDDPAVVGELQRLLLTPAETPLSEAVGPEAMAALRTLLPRFPADRIDTLEAWSAYFVALSLKIAALAETQPETGAPRPPMDQEIITRTRERGGELHGLESPTDVVSALRQLTDEQYARLIVELATEDEEESFEAAVDELVAAYRAGDLEALAAVSAAADGADSPEARELMRLLLVERNALWMPSLRRAIARDGAFIAVGAAHLIGPRGLLEMLRVEGYSVTRL